MSPTLAAHPPGDPPTLYKIKRKDKPSIKHSTSICLARDASVAQSAKTLPYHQVVPEGTNENSPTFQRGGKQPCHYKSRRDGRILMRKCGSKSCAIV